MGPLTIFSAVIFSFSAALHFVWRAARVCVYVPLPATIDYSIALLARVLACVPPAAHHTEAG